MTYNHCELSYQNCGEFWAVFLKSQNTEKIEQSYNSFWNHGATSGKLHFLSDTFGYFWTTAKTLKKALVNQNLFRMLNEADEMREQDPKGWAHCCKGIKGGFLPRAEELASEQFDSLMGNHERAIANNASTDYYELGTISAEKPDSDYGNKEK